MKTFMQWLEEKRLAEDGGPTTIASPMDVQKAMANALNPLPNPGVTNDNQLVNQFVQKAPKTLIATMANNATIKQMAVAGALSNKNKNQSQTVVPQGPNQPMATGTANNPGMT